VVLTGDDVNPLPKSAQNPSVNRVIVLIMISQINGQVP